jgi:hypothetical protein
MKLVCIKEAANNVSCSLKHAAALLFTSSEMVNFTNYQRALSFPTLMLMASGIFGGLATQPWVIYPSFKGLQLIFLQRSSASDILRGQFW